MQFYLEKIKLQVLITFCSFASLHFASFYLVHHILFLLGFSLSMLDGHM